MTQNTEEVSKENTASIVTVEEQTEQASMKQDTCLILACLPRP
jgi:hypothetical protein